MRVASALCAVISSSVLLGCAATSQRPDAANEPGMKTTKASPAEADAFVATVNQEIRDHIAEDSAAQWIAATYITADSGLLESKYSERALIRLKNNIEASRRFDGMNDLSAATARGIEMLKRQSAMPTPKDPAHLAEMASLASKLGAAYGAGKYCKNPADPATCRNLDQLSKTLASSSDWDEDLEAWVGWHSVGSGMRADYQRFTELLN